MLWSIVAVLSGLVFLSLTIDSIFKRDWLYVRSRAPLLVVWGGNIFFGLAGFLVAPHVVYAVWKTWLMASTLANIVMLGVALYLRRKERLAEQDRSERGAPEELERADDSTVLVAFAGLLCFVGGWLALLLVWLLAI